jgi:N-acetylglucosamine-6-phosphate deacetylase
MNPHKHAVAAERLFDGSSDHKHAAVLIEGDRIVWTGPRQALDPDIPLHVLPKGFWIAPGFIDVQVNGGGDVLFNDDPSPAGIARIVAAHRRHGTTGLLPTLISDNHERMRAALDAVRQFSQGAGVLGIHFEGPFLSPLKPGVHDPDRFRLPSEDDFTLLTAPTDLVKLVTLAPEQVPGRFIGDLVNAGVRVALGHSMATYAETKQALGLGLTGFTHLFNAMRALSPRDPGPIAAALESQQAWFGMIVDGLHVDPAMLRLALRGRARPMLVTDAMPLVGSNRAEFLLFKRRIHASGEACFDDDGVLAGSVLTMSSAVRNCVKLLDVSLSEALRYASTEPAAFLGLSHQLGRLAPGYRADMVAFHGETISVLGTWLSGRWQASHLFPG